MPVTFRFTLVAARVLRYTRTAMRFEWDEGKNESYVTLL